MPDSKPLAEASRRLKARELLPAQLARAHRDALREDRQRTRQAIERIKAAQARIQRDLEHVHFWAAHEAMLAWRPEPPAVPVPEEPRYSLSNRPPVMNYAFRPRNGY